MQTKERDIGLYGELISFMFNQTFQQEYGVLRNFKLKNGEYAYPELSEQPEREILIIIQPDHVNSTLLRNEDNGSFAMFDDELCQKLYDEGNTDLWQDGKWIEGGIITFNPELKGKEWYDVIYHELCHAFFHLAGSTIYCEPITYTFCEWIDMAEWDFKLKELCLRMARINLERESGTGLTHEHLNELIEVMTEIPLKILDKIQERLGDIHDS